MLLLSPSIPQLPVCGLRQVYDGVGICQDVFMAKVLCQGTHFFCVLFKLLGNILGDDVSSHFQFSSSCRAHSSLRCHMSSHQVSSHAISAIPLSPPHHSCSLLAILSPPNSKSTCSTQDPCPLSSHPSVPHSHQPPHSTNSPTPLSVLLP